jgi:hypothetical protein
MKISVRSRSGRSGNEPHRLCLGQCSLPVISILNRHDEGEARVFDVRVLDGRRFVVRRQTEFEQWELIGVYGRAVRRMAPARPIASLLLLLSVALCRKALTIAKRGRKSKANLPSGVLPSGGAPA